MAREQPEQQAPPVQRLRIRYAKRGRLRFTSHRDFSRAFERAVFRARVPMAYSSGFNPHPRISYAGAAPTGSASEAEYLELALAEVVDPATIHASLAEALPDGLDIVEVVESPGGSLADLLEASRWRLEVPGAVADVEADVAAFLAADRGHRPADEQEGDAGPRRPVARPLAPRGRVGAADGDPGARAAAPGPGGAPGRRAVRHGRRVRARARRRTAPHPADAGSARRGHRRHRRSAPHPA